MKQEILARLELREDHEYECKLAAKGLPVSIWETYSSLPVYIGTDPMSGTLVIPDAFE